MSFDTTRSQRHPKIAGDFFEHLVLYLLSMDGFECALIDHVGIDILARNPHDGELMGISVKGRTRNTEQRAGTVNVKLDQLEKLKVAAKAFDCTPYFAFVVHSRGTIRGAICPLRHLSRRYPPSQTNLSWRMGDESILKYRKDSKVKIFEFREDEHKWW